MDNLRRPTTERGLPPLEPGDHLDQKTFHARYEAMPPGVRAELIGGVVFILPRLGHLHGRIKFRLVAWLSRYEERTPGVEAYGSVTVLLEPKNEPEPDACLVVAPRCGGRTREEDEYLAGPPELMVEVATSSESIDLHRKRQEYERAGVREYLAVALRQGWVYWFGSCDGYFVELDPGPDGVLRSEEFPGLWLDPAALLRTDAARPEDVLGQGLATPEHAAFVAKLAAGPSV